MLINISDLRSLMAAGWIHSDCYLQTDPMKVNQRADESKFIISATGLIMRFPFESPAS